MNKATYSQKNAANIVMIKIIQKLSTLYGKTSKEITRQALHALKVSFIHPIYKKEVFYIAPIPDDMKCLL